VGQSDSELDALAGMLREELDALLADKDHSSTTRPPLRAPTRSSSPCGRHRRAPRRGGPSAGHRPRPANRSRSGFTAAMTRAAGHRVVGRGGLTVDDGSPRHFARARLRHSTARCPP
jgi:hypothetical protein